MQVPIVNGIYVDQVARFRTRYPRNLIPVPKQSGVSQGYLRPSEGIVAFGAGGPGVGRGGIVWNGALYRVMGSKLVRVAADGTVTVLGDVGGVDQQVTMDYSFDRLAIASMGFLYYWDGTTLTQVNDPDLGTVVDFRWIAGYFMTTDGAFLVVTELNDPTSVNPLKYGSSEADPDPVLAVDELKNEAYAFNRFTIEVFQNIGGDNFPFARIEGAQVGRGIIGTHAYAPFVNSFAFVGSARNEAPSVYLMLAGDTAKLATSEIDQILAGYTEQQLAAIVVESRVWEGHEHLLIHLPDRCLVYDASASKVIGEPVWFTLGTSVADDALYRARNFVWCYDLWTVEDPSSTALGRMVNDLSTHYGQTIGWDCQTQVLYNEGNDAIVHELELVALPGRVAFGADPVIWTSYSHDGKTWSQERPTAAGRQGQRDKRIAWRRQGRIRNTRMQRFRGTSDAHVSLARLELAVEALHTRPGAAA